jgi:uncharacterized membrane protein
MNWGEATLQWLHILFGTFWFGGALFANFVVVPAMMRLSAWSWPASAWSSR